MLKTEAGFAGCESLSMKRFAPSYLLYIQMSCLTGLWQFSSDECPIDLYRSATMSGVPSVLGGLDMTMPGDVSMHIT